VSRGRRSVETASLGRQKLNGIAGPHNDGEKVLIAIRPESLTLSPFQPGQARPVVAGRVQARQYLGGRQTLHIAVERRHVWLKWAPDTMSMLDPD
jgi:ABC-type Fe3+/spermidine/putrescine transport system ATPase subunit